MFAPNKIWRKWHRMTNTNERRLAICAALAASAVPALVIARGHRIGKLEEVPLVLSSGVESVQKTKDAVKILARHHADLDIARSEQSKKVRTGKGKMRNRRYTLRRGPLLVYADNQNVEHAFRNIVGLDVANVDRLSLLQLAPGGHLGRFIIWTQAAFEKLDKIFGTLNKKSHVKRNFTLPHPVMANADVTRIINSDEVQSKLNRKKQHARRLPRKLNPLRNVGALIRLNPYAQTQRRAQLKLQLKKTQHKPTKPTNLGALKPTTKKERKAAFRRMTQSFVGTSDQQGAQFLGSYNNLRASGGKKAEE
jgi:large subunit ribosomal protein L4e